MVEIKPLKLTSIGGGEGKLEEFAASDTLPSAIVGLGNVDNTSDASKPVSSAQANALSGKEPAIPLDVVSKFWSGTKAWRDLAADVRASVLTGLSTATSTVVAATDTLLAAIGKLQAQVNLRAPIAAPTFTGSAYFEGAVFVATKGGSLEIGRTDGTATAAVLDFHSGAVVTDYDARIYATGGSSTVAQGDMVIAAKTLSYAGAPTAGNHLVNKTYADSKEPAITSGTTAQFISGDKSLRDLATDVRTALGASASNTVQTSAVDTTAGRLLTVGAIGLGAEAITPPADMDSITVAGFASCVGGTANGPGYPGNLVTLVGAAPTRKTQIASEIAGTSRLSYRATSDTGVYTPWYSVFTSVGLNTITTDIGAIGYGTGAGGTVAQATSKSTSVTLNKPSGRITATAGSLAANTAVSFTLTNSRIAASDTLSVNIISGATAGAYVVQVDAAAAGSCRISIRNMTAGALAEAIVMQFNVIKGAIA
jgi:hypothetical protein